MRRRRKGEGSYIIDKKTGRFEYYEWYVGLDGSNKRKHIRGISEKDLNCKVAIWKERVAEGDIGTEKNKKITVAQWADRYKEIIKPSVKVKTFDHYNSIIKKYIVPHLGEKKLRCLTTEQVQLWLNNLLETQGLSASTIATIRRCLIMMLNVAMQFRIIFYNAAFYSKPPKIRRRTPQVLTIDQIRNLLAIAAQEDFLNCGLKEIHVREDFDIFLHKNYFVALFLSIFCGTRKGETFALRWEDFNPDERLLKITHSLSNYKGTTSIDETKTSHSQRTILLPHAVSQLLERWHIEQNSYAHQWAGFYRNSLNLILTNSKGSPVSFTNLHKRWWGPLRMAANIPESFKWHNLRATNATLLAVDHIDIKTVSERLGHSSPVVTEQFYLGNTQRQNQAADALDRVINNVLATESTKSNIMNNKK